MKCPYCGSNNPENSKFCTNCGATVKVHKQSQPQESTIKKKKKVSRLRILIVFVIIILIAAIGSNFSNDKNDSFSNNEDTTVTLESQSKETKLKIGSTATISTSQGDYKITITGVEKGTINEFTDPQPKKIVRINYEYENESVDSVTVSYLYFRVYDANGNLLETYPDPDVKQPSQISAGKKNTASCSYGLNCDSNYIELEVLPIDNPVKAACKFELKW